MLLLSLKIVLQTCQMRNRSDQYTGTPEVTGTNRSTVPLTAQSAYTLYVYMNLAELTLWVCYIIVSSLIGEICMSSGSPDIKIILLLENRHLAKVEMNLHFCGLIYKWSYLLVKIITTWNRLSCPIFWLPIIEFARLHLNGLKCICI
jgi:hypothetical protein